MDPTQAFCHHPLCPARGQPGLGNIKVHSHKEQRFRCTACGKTFAASTGTPFYRLHKAHSLLVLVVTLLAHGCPLQDLQLSCAERRNLGGALACLEPRRNSG